MRILVLNWRDLANPGAGGAERYVHEVARRWVEAGHEVTLFCAQFPGASAADERDGVRIVRGGTRWSVFRHAAAFLWRTSGRWDAVIESINTRPFFVHRVVPELPTVAIIHQLARDVWFHEAPLPLAVAGRFALEPLWLRGYRDVPVVTVSDSTRRDLEGLGFRRLAVVPPGRPTPPVIAAAKQSVPSLLFIGRLKRSKRPRHAFDAFRIVRRFHPQAQMWIVGDGPLRASLERDAGEGMTVLGRVDERLKWELLARSHLLLVPSVREGWGLVVMEGAVVGTPSIGYRVPGLVDAIRHGETGWLCDPNPDALATSVLQALQDPALEAIGSRARKWVEGFSWDRAADEILSLMRVPEPAWPYRSWRNLSFR